MDVVAGDGLEQEFQRAKQLLEAIEKAKIGFYM